MMEKKRKLQGLSGSYKECVGIMEGKMETTGFIGIILGSEWGTSPKYCSV